MRSTYFENDDILKIRLTRDGQAKPIVREVSQDWHTHISYAADGTIVEIVLLDAKKQGLLPVEFRKAARVVPSVKSTPDENTHKIQTAKTQQRRLMPTPKALQKALEKSAQQAQRLADAFGVKVPVATRKSSTHKAG